MSTQVNNVCVCVDHKGRLPGYTVVVSGAPLFVRDKAPEGHHGILLFGLGKILILNWSLIWSSNVNPTRLRQNQELGN